MCVCLWGQCAGAKIKPFGDVTVSAMSSNKINPNAPVLQPDDARVNVLLLYTVLYLRPKRKAQFRIGTTPPHLVRWENHKQGFTTVAA